MAIDLSDKSSGGHTLTNNGATEVTINLPFAASTIAVDCASASSQYLTTADHNDFSVTTTSKLSIEFWAKPASLSNNNYAIFKGASSNFEFGIVVGNASGAVQCNFWNSSGASRYQNVTAGSAVSAGTWYHIAVTVDNSLAWADSNCKLYINASESTSTYGGNSANSLSNGTAAFEIARRQDTSVFYNGQIDEVRVWNTVRSSTELNDNKSIELVGTESGLVAYWPFESLDSFIPKVIFI